MTLERATDLAFRGRLAAAARALEKQDPPDPGVRWLRAYIASARGDFAPADRIAREILRAPGVTASTRARTATTLGSILRQTERHAEGRDVERNALRSAKDPEQRAHLLIGLAADAVGLGRLADVDTALRRVPATRDWRVLVRLRWVRCERELLAGRPGAAARHAREALAIATEERAARHEAKSQLFLGAALREQARGESGDLSREAARSLRRAHVIARRIGARPIAAVAADLLRRLGSPPRG